MANGFRYWAREVRVVRTLPGGLSREWRAYMLFHSDQGVIEAGTDVVVGDEIYGLDLFRRRKTARVVAHIDWDGQSDLNRGVITWAGSSRRRAGQEGIGMTLDLDVHGFRLLEWVYDEVGTQLGYLQTEGFADTEGLSLEGVRLVVQSLELRGLVEAQHSIDNGFPRVKITNEGHMHRQQVLAARQDVAQRTRVLRQRMLLWLHEQEHRQTPPPDWSGFVASPDGQFYGFPFTETELATAISDLAAKNLITGRGSWQAGQVSLRPSLTTEGRDCVIDSGGNVSEYVDRQRGGTTTNVTMTNVSGQTVIASDNVKQNMTSGLDTSKLLDFAGFVRQVLPTLGLPNDEQTELDDRAEKLHEAASSQAPDKGNLRRLIDAVMAGLTKAAPTVVSGAAITMGNDAIKAITGS